MHNNFNVLFKTMGSNKLKIINVIIYLIFAFVCEYMKKAEVKKKVEYKKELEVISRLFYQITTYVFFSVLFSCFNLRDKCRMD